MTFQASLPSLRPDYIARELKRADAPAMFALQKSIQLELGEPYGHFIIPKTLARLESFTDRPHLAIGMVTPRGELAAMALVGVPNVLEPAAGPNSGLIQSVFVHPLHREQRLMDQVLQAVEKRAAEAGLTTLNSRVADGNTPSEKGFLRNGYVHYGAGRRDLDGTLLTLFKKELPPAPNASAKPMGTVSHLRTYKR